MRSNTATLTKRLTILASALFACLSPQTAFAETPQRPNIILMMGDDHGWEETGYNGHPHVKTPVLDAMASEGLKFDRFYAGHPNCSPTRASFLSGRHPNRMGTFAPGWSIRPEEITIAHLMSRSGYRCGHFGKWHVGPVKASSPTNPGAMGFHEWVSHDNFFEIDPKLSRNGGPPEAFEGESSAILIDETIRFIDSSARNDQPFLAVVWFGSPHEPYSGLPDDLKLYDDLPSKYSELVQVTSNETGANVKRPQGEVLRERYAEITAMDREIGRLRDHLKSKGLKQNTLLFYCGDNGTSADSALGLPHRGVKGQVYEGGVLVPGIIEWPARIPQPRQSSFRASTLDLLPTLCESTGQTLPNRPIDGVSLVGVLDGKTTDRPSPLHFWEFEAENATKGKPKPWIDPELQSGTTPLVKLMGGKATRDFKNFRHDYPTADDYAGPRAVIDGKMKLVIHDLPDGKSKFEFFDLEADPGEKSNLIEHRRDESDMLAENFRAWQTSVLRSLAGKDYEARP
jgi:arylsulfatase A-like enzyme